MPEIFGKYLDRLMTVQMQAGHRPGRMPTRGYILKLYEWAREKTGGPLTYLAAKNIVDNVKKGDFIFLMAEAAFPPYLYVGETDGPMGTAALARMFDVAFGAKPVIIASPDKVDANIAVWNAAELEIQPEEVIRKRVYGGAIAEPFPINDDEAKKMASELVNKYNPSIMISVETLGVNSKGNIHCITGSDSTPYIMKAHHLINEAKKKGIFTIGIGDGGNEIGFGNIYKELSALGDAYVDCRPFCTCGGGIRTVVETDLLIPAAVSNWGAYGVEACVAAMVGDLDVMHNLHVERRMLEACADVGLSRALKVHGHGPEACLALITILREMVNNYLKGRKERAF